MTTDSPITIRAARSSDTDAILAVFDDARRFQRSSGFIQWLDGYPSRATVESDLAAGGAYIVETGGVVTGYFFIAYDDPGYDDVTEAAWSCPGRFAVVHRLALSYTARGRGLGTVIIREAERIAAEGGASSMRVDTWRDNMRMRHIMASLGYEPRGELTFPWGPRLAYEHPLGEGQKSR